MIRKLLLFIIILPFLGLAQNKISYKVYYDKNSGQDGLKIQVDYTGKTASEVTDFYYSNENWGEKDLFKCLILHQEDNPEVRFETRPEKDEVRIHHKNGKKVSFTYRIRQDFEDPNHRIFNRPRISNHFFYALGRSLFIVPKSFTEMADDKELDFSIEWIGFPADFKIHNTFASQPRKQKIRTVLWEGFYNSLFVGGDYRVYDFKVHDKPVYFAIRDEWNNGFSDDFLLSNLKKSVQSQRDFWKDYDKDYFTIIMSPTVSTKDSTFKGYSTTGSAIKNAFMIQGTNNPFNNKNSYLYLLHHEMMHDWIGTTIKNKHEELNYWFSEGFTDYYTYKNRLRIKDISFDEWMNLFNDEVIKNHWKNPQRNIANYTIKDDFWKSRDVEKVPYRRGAIFAFWLDNQILIKSNYKKSLDDLMQELLKTCKEKKVKFTDELFLDLTQKYLNEDISYFFQKHILSGTDIDLPREQWINGLQFKVTDQIPQIQADKNVESRYILR